MSASASITHVLYHAHCPDGFGAAWSAWQVRGEAAEYLPVRHGDAPPELPAHAQVAIVDFSYDREVLLAMQASVQSLVVLDHHKSAQDQLSGLDFAFFDMEQSGARMAWNYWHPGKPIPELLAYVEDRDLWRWALPDSREVSLAMHCYPMDFPTWNGFSIAELRTEGRALVRYQNGLIARAASRARLSQIGEYLVPTVNSCLFQSELGDELCRLNPDAPFVGIWYVNPDGKEAWSLRSRNDFDVSAVAALYGGGGHRNAAGFARPHPGAGELRKQERSVE